MSNKPETRTFSLVLTKDELTILKYVVPDSSWGDPLKDTYELGDDEPEDSYKVLKTLARKIYSMSWAPKES